MGEKEQAIRLPDSVEGEFPEGFDDSKICYWRLRGIWMLYLPRGGGGNLSNHTVVEHEDGTITVSPSIRVSSPRNKTRHRHGFLKKGIWEPCADDGPR